MQPASVLPRESGPAYEGALSTLEPPLDRSLGIDSLSPVTWVGIRGKLNLAQLSYAVRWANPGGLALRPGGSVSTSSVVFMRCMRRRVGVRGALCRIELGTLGLTRRSHKLRCGVKRLYKSAVYGYFKPKK